MPETQENQQKATVCKTVAPVHARRLSRDELRLLISVLDAEINRTGLDQEHGRRAAALKAKLLAIHEHGFEN